MDALVIRKDTAFYKVALLNQENKIVDAIVAGKNRFVKTNSVKTNFLNLSEKKEIQFLKQTPKIGDIVELKDFQGQYIIEKIKPRENEFVRPDCANIDQLILVFSVTDPEFSFMLLDNFLLVCAKKRIQPILVLTKIDIDIEKTKKVLTDLQYYEKYLNLKVFTVDNNNFNFDHSDIFKNKVTILTGQTGVGKSSFLNNLIPEINQKTGETSKSLGRGKHTTRNSELFNYMHGYIGDTPGFSLLNSGIILETELKKYYPDFNLFSQDCKFKNKCLHLNIQAKDCKVVELHETKVIGVRYLNYQKIYAQIKHRRTKQKWKLPHLS